MPTSRSTGHSTSATPPGPSASAGVPGSGDVLQVTRAASVQFRTPIFFRVIRVHDWPTYTGWVWLDGYQLNEAGEAVERRSIFVQLAGLRRVTPAAAQRTPRQPRQRSSHPGGAAGTPSRGPRTSNRSARLPH